MAETNINVELGKKIKIALIERNKTPKDLAMYLNKSKASISVMLAGKKNIEVEELKTIGEFLDKPLDYFITPF